MKHGTLIGYTYEADAWHVECAPPECRQYGDDPDACEEHEIGAILEGQECLSDIICAECGDPIQEPWPEHEAETYEDD